MPATKSPPEGRRAPRTSDDAKSEENGTWALSGELGKFVTVEVARFRLPGWVHCGCAVAPAVAQGHWALYIAAYVCVCVREVTILRLPRLLAYYLGHLGHLEL